MAVKDWPEWQEQCARLSKANAERGYTHAAGILEKIASTRILYGDVPMSAISPSVVENIATVLDVVSERFSVMVWLAQMKYWVRLCDAEDEWAGEHLSLATANSMASSGRFKDWLLSQLPSVK